jgi:acyl carrier protein
MSPMITPIEMKQFIVNTLELDDVQPEEIGDDEPLFKGGLGLDSIDGLELDIALRKKFHLEAPEDKSAAVHAETTVRSLVDFLASQAKP